MNLIRQEFEALPLELHTLDFFLAKFCVSTKETSCLSFWAGDECIHYTISCTHAHALHKQEPPNLRNARATKSSYPPFMNEHFKMRCTKWFFSGLALICEARIDSLPFHHRDDWFAVIYFNCWANIFSYLYANSDATTPLFCQQILHLMNGFQLHRKPNEIWERANESDRTHFIFVFLFLSMKKKNTTKLARIRWGRIRCISRMHLARNRMTVTPYMEFISCAFSMR